MKNGVSWENGFASGDAYSKIVPENALFSRLTRRESFTFVAFKTDSSIKWKLVYSRICF